jgi:hypothetical protein
VIFGCSGRPAHEFLDTHPEFSPIVPRTGQVEYQVTWYRSWQPLIHLRVRIETPDLTDRPQAYVSYAVSNDGVNSLKTETKSTSEVANFPDILQETGFWEPGLECYEQAYREGRDYVPEADRCEWILVMDGASMSIAASEQNRSKAINIQCSSSASCEPYDGFAKAILRSVGLENVAIMK